MVVSAELEQEEKMAVSTELEQEEKMVVSAEPTEIAEPIEE